jgi:hypothetical protein
MNWKGYGRNLSWPNLEYYAGNYLEGMRKTQKLHSGEPVCEPTFEHKAFRIRSRSTNHCFVCIYLFKRNITLMLFHASLGAAVESATEVVYI